MSCVNFCSIFKNSYKIYLYIILNNIFPHSSYWTPSSSKMSATLYTVQHTWAQVKGNPDLAPAQGSNDWTFNNLDDAVSFAKKIRKDSPMGKADDDWEECTQLCWEREMIPRTPIEDSRDACWCAFSERVIIFPLKFDSTLRLFIISLDQSLEDYLLHIQPSDG